MSEFSPPYAGPLDCLLLFQDEAAKGGFPLSCLLQSYLFCHSEQSQRVEGEEHLLQQAL